MGSSLFTSTQRDRNRRILLCQQVCSGALTVPIVTIVAFWHSIGIPMATGLVLQAIFRWASIALDLPTGYIGDRIGRKRMLILGAASGALGSLTYALADGFAMAAAAEILFGLSSALGSGADNALLFDSERAAGSEEQYLRSVTRIRRAMLIAMALWPVLGGWTIYLGARAPFALAALVMGFSTLVGCALVEPPNGETHHEARRTEQFWIGLTGGILNCRIVCVAVEGAALFALFNLGFWMIQGALAENNASSMLVGTVITCSHLMAWAASHERIVSALDRSRRWRWLVWATLPIGFMMMTFGTIGWIVMGLMVHQLGRGPSAPLFSNEINGLVKTRFRATVLSIQSTAAAVLAGIMMPLLAWGLVTYGSAATITGLAVVAIAVPISTAWLRPKDR